jgi:hypothetical protein
MERDETHVYIAIENLLSVCAHDYPNEEEFFATMKECWECVKALDSDAADTTFKAILYTKLAPGIRQRCANVRDRLDYINEVLQRSETAGHERKAKDHGTENPLDDLHEAEYPYDDRYEAENSQSKDEWGNRIIDNDGRRHHGAVSHRMPDRISNGWNTVAGMKQCQDASEPSWESLSWH